MNAMAPDFLQKNSEVIEKHTKGIRSDLQNDDTRLWIGNLDSRISEYQLIKILQKFGKVVKFDFLFHKSGPLQGQPRGYCFVTYETQNQAKHALQALDGQFTLSKKLSVKWAHLKIKEDDDKSKRIKSLVPGLTPLPNVNPEISLATKIHAIEAKLKLMEENKDHEALVIQPISAHPPPAEHPQKLSSSTTSCRTAPYRRQGQTYRFKK